MMTQVTTALIGLGSYLKRIFIALSVLLNVTLGGCNNQTFSARNYQWKKDRRMNIVRLIDLFLGENHCLECWVYWKVRKKW